MANKRQNYSYNLCISLYINQKAFEPHSCILTDLTNLVANPRVIFVISSWAFPKQLVKRLLLLWWWRYFDIWGRKPRWAFLIDRNMVWNALLDKSPPNGHSFVFVRNHLIEKRFYNGRRDALSNSAVHFQLIASRVCHLRLLPQLYDKSSPRYIWPPHPC